MKKKPTISIVKKENLTESKHFHLFRDLDKDIINIIDYAEFTEDNGFVSVRVFFKQNKKQEISTSSQQIKETQFDKNSDATKIKK